MLRNCPVLPQRRSGWSRPVGFERADKRAMTRNPQLSAATLVAELAYLIDLPVEERGPDEVARYDEVRWALADIDPGGRMSAYEAAVAAIDPDHVLGPYPDSGIELSIELYAYEEWRLGRVYNSTGPEADLARRLLCVAEILFYTWEPEETFTCMEVTNLLRFRRIGPEDFPGFSLEVFHRTSGVDVTAREAAVAAYAAAARALMQESLSDD